MFKPRPLRPIDRFNYMHLAKMLEGSRGTFLSGSTMVQPSFEEMGVTEKDFDLHALADAYGDPRTLNLLSDRFGVPASQITMTAGSSEANALIYQALLEPGDEVIAECPGYEVFWLLPKLYYATAKKFPRREENGFIPDPAELKAMLTPKTRLVVLTDLHNPTNAKIPADVLKEIFAICAANGTWVLVDEVYLDHLEPGSADPTCYHYADNVIVTSSLTKVYGLGVLRYGWCFAPEELSQHILDQVDLTTVCLPGIAMNFGTRALQNLDRLRARARVLRARGRPIFEEWAASRNDCTFFDSPGGITVAAKFEGIGDDAKAAQYLERVHKICVAPGSAFEMKGWLRINLTKEPDALRAALKLLGTGIDAWKMLGK